MKNTNSPHTKGRQPRRGWRQAFPNEPGLYRLHRVDCPASLKRTRQPKCSCSFYCHHPTGIAGKTSLRRLDARDLSDAKLAKKRVQGAGSSDAPVGFSPTLTVKQFFEQVFLPGKRLNPSTERNYRSRFTHDLQARIGRRRMRDVTIHDINGLVTELEKDMVRRREELGRPNPRHVENRLTVVKSIFRYAHEMGYISRNPAAAVKPPRGSERLQGEDDPHDARRILTDAQGQLLAAWLRRLVAGGGVPARKAIGIAFGLFMALRIGEACAIWWSDVDFEEGVLDVRRQWKGGHAGFSNTKSGEPRKIRIPAPLL